MKLRTSWCVFALLLGFAGHVLAQPIGKPDWFPLPPDQQKKLDEVLKYWEWKAAKIERYSCKFTRWEYDSSTFSRPTDSNDTATVISQGSIQFASPDKGLFHVESCWRVAVEHIPAAEQRVVTVPVIKDGRAQYTEQKQIIGEHWICDGKSVFEFDSLNKQLIKRELPAEMQGKQIVAGPLPFLFGAKAYELNDRYWLHLVPPLEPGQFWLEAIPKRQADAADFQSLVVIIDEKEFLPAGLILVKRGVGPQNGKNEDRYKFDKREHNWNITLEKLNIFKRQFYEPAVPEGWKLVKEKFGADPAPAAANAAPLGPAPARQTQRPPAGPQRPPAVPLRR